MSTVFFDLETTDLEFCGQILNYAFVEVDDDWNRISELTGDILISRLQLPRAGAICANRVDVLKHQKEATDTEQEAMVKIREYLLNITEHSTKPVMLVGQNSAKFDVPYLRTSMIRNGISPYFGKNLIYGDMKFVAQKAMTMYPDLQEVIFEDAERPLSLENQCKKMGILGSKDKQLHNSMDDVDLTIQLAFLYADEFKLDVRMIDTYELQPYEKKPAVVTVQYVPTYGDNRGVLQLARMICLDYDKRQALWINLEEFRALVDTCETFTNENVKDCIHWYNKNSTGLFLHGIPQTERELDTPTRNLVSAAIQVCGSRFSLENWWPEKNCDLEAHIYMLEFNEMDALADAIYRHDLSTIKKLKSKRAATMYLRHLMRKKALTPTDWDRLTPKLREYALYRYGGKMKLDKFDPDVKYEPGVYSESFHVTWNELLAEMKNIWKAANARNDAEDNETKRLMDNLLKFYKSSDINRIAGDQLSKIKRCPPRIPE